MNRPGKLAIFIDGPNLHHSSKALGFDVDFRRLTQEFEKRGTLLRAYYYTTVDDRAEFTNARPLVEWLDYNGFTVKVVPTREFDDGSGRRKIKRNIGVELSVDALEVARYVEQVVLFSGDGDFCRLVKAVQLQGASVTAVSTIRTKPAMIANELRRQVDAFLELDGLKGSIGRMLPTTAAQ